MADPETRPQTAFHSKFLITDDEMRAIGVPEHEWSAFRHAKYQRSFDIQSWSVGTRAGEYTFRGEQVLISLDESRAILARYQRRKAMDTSVTRALPMEVQDAELAELADRLTEVLQRCFGDAGAMAKLSTRSAKDVPLYCDDFGPTAGFYTEELAKVPVDQRTEAAELRAFVIATTRAMRVFTGNDIIELFTRSERVASDINKTLAFDPSLFCNSIELRAWDPEVVDHPQYEFRGFVHNRRLTALSTYFTFIYDEAVLAQRDAIAAAAQSFHASIADSIPHESYVIDFYIDVTRGRTLIIELNPFHTLAGAAHFSWKLDRPLFLGERPFELRLTTEPFAGDADGPLGILPPVWQRKIAASRLPGSPSIAEAAARARAKAQAKADADAAAQAATQADDKQCVVM